MTGLSAQPSPQRGGAMVMGGCVSSSSASITNLTAASKPTHHCSIRTVRDGVYAFSRASEPLWQDGRASTSNFKGPCFLCGAVRR
jgi:hypothetical protein